MKRKRKPQDKVVAAWARRRKRELHGCQVVARFECFLLMETGARYHCYRSAPPGSPPDVQTLHRDWDTDGHFAPLNGP